MLFSFFAPASKAQTSGCISGDCINGIGTFLFADKAEYTGEWVNGVRTGVGCYDWADGSYYLGYFENGKLEGNGIYLGNDDAETTLIGVFHEGKLSESRDLGTSGCLIGNCYEGVGIYLWSNDDLYVGEWHSGIRTGYGRFDWGDGSFYTGYFKDNLLDGRGYYSKTDGTDMDGYFEKNVFIRKEEYKQDEQNQVSSSNSAPQNFTYITYDDVCALLKEVIRSFPSDFNTVKGKVNDDYLALSDWQSTVSLKGSIESGIFAALDNKYAPALWYNEVESFTDVKQAMNKYDEVVSYFSKCGATCCQFSQRSTSKANERYTTYFEPLSVNSGASSEYNDMQVIIELTYSDYSKSWSLELQVLNESKF